MDGGHHLLKGLDRICICLAILGIVAAVGIDIPHGGFVFPCLVPGHGTVGLHSANRIRRRNGDTAVIVGETGDEVVSLLTRNGQPENVIGNANLERHWPGVGIDKICSGERLRSPIYRHWRIKQHSAVAGRLRHLVRASVDMFFREVDEITVHVPDLRAGRKRDERNLAWIASTYRGRTLEKVIVACGLCEQRKFHFFVAVVSAWRDINIG